MQPQEWRRACGTPDHQRWLLAMRAVPIMVPKVLTVLIASAAKRTGKSSISSGRPEHIYAFTIVTAVSHFSFAITVVAAKELHLRGCPERSCTFTVVALVTALIATVPGRASRFVLIR